jgi:hypothetical protein
MIIQASHIDRIPEGEANKIGTHRDGDALMPERVRSNQPRFLCARVATADAELLHSSQCSDCFFGFDTCGSAFVRVVFDSEQNALKG